MSEKTKAKKWWKPPAAEAVLCWMPDQVRHDIGCGLGCCALVLVRWSLANRVGNELPGVQGCWYSGSAELRVRRGTTRTARYYAYGEMAGMTLACSGVGTSLRVRRKVAPSFSVL